MRAPPPLFFPSTSHTHHSPSLSSFLSLCRVHPHIELLPLPLRQLWNRRVGDVCRHRQGPGIRLNPAGDCAKRRDHFLEQGGRKAAAGAASSYDVVMDPWSYKVRGFVAQVALILSSTCWATTAGWSGLISKAVQTFSMKLSLNFAALFLCDVRFLSSLWTSLVQVKFQRDNEGQLLKEAKVFFFISALSKNTLIMNAWTFWLHLILDIIVFGFLGWIETWSKTAGNNEIKNIFGTSSVGPKVLCSNCHTVQCESIHYTQYINRLISVKLKVRTDWFLTGTLLTPPPGKPWLCFPLWMLTRWKQNKETTAAGGE